MTISLYQPQLLYRVGTNLVCLKEVDNIWKRFEKKIELVENAWKLAVSLHQRPQALHRAVICPEIMENTALPPTSTHSLLSPTSSTSTSSTSPTSTPTSTTTSITTEMIVNIFPPPIPSLHWAGMHCTACSWKLKSTAVKLVAMSRCT